MRSLIKLLRTTLIDLNIFSLRDMGSGMDRIIAKRLGQWATRLYIALFIGGLSILTIYTVVQPQVVTKTFNKPSFRFYNDSRQKYGDELKCPCSVIASTYDQFIEIEPIFHAICMSPFATKQYRNDLISGLISNLSIYVSRDYRRFLSAHLQALQGLCQLSNTSVYDSINQFRTSLFVTSQLLSETNFRDQLDSLIEQTKSNVPTTFRQLLFLIRNINHGNAYMSTYTTNFEYIGVPNSRKYTYASTRAIIYDGCSCGLYLNCTSQANFIKSNSSEITPIKGLKIGCTPSESFRASTLECFYDRSCIDLVHKYTNYTKSHNPLLANRSRFSINTTIAVLIDNLFIEKWETKMNYSSYFHACSLSYCSYTYIQKKSSFIYIITVLLGLQGGLAIVLKWICPKIVRIAFRVNNYRKKRMNTIHPVNSLEITPNVTLSTTIHNPASNSESRPTSITSREHLSNIFLLVSSASATVDTNLNSTINTTTSTLSSTTAPLCKLEFRSISINISDIAYGDIMFAVADFNDDSRLDIMVFSNYHESVIILSGNANGRFTKENIFQKGSFLWMTHMKVGDFNNDNRADLVFTISDANYVNILFGNSNGTFRVRNIILGTTKCIPDDIVVVDFNHDNYSDIAVINTVNSNVCVFFGNANDTFSPQLMFSTGYQSEPESLTVSDFNSDGHVDIAVTNSRAVNVGIFLGCGNGTFEVQKRSYTFLGSDPHHSVSGDFDGDAQPDVVVSDERINIVTVLSKYRNGFFTVKNNFVMKSNRIPSTVVVGDFNCDDHLDIAAAGRPYGIDVLLGYGDGYFETQNILSDKMVRYGSDIGVYDFNDDTYQDIIITNSDSRAIDILLNICECDARGISKRKMSNLS
ncbi:unnamed protein product [Adineta steineri]|uniref:Uncharacterized protein n=1 Tax=Adineta steineri TaxID=433720 RepID=A0A815EYF6_9BILA|nr:unnamed protein product [Adineta steineri]CAF1318633.1 unnamed protein product [Adineta steineri]